MNGLTMNMPNFMFGVLMGRDLEQRQRILLGLTASMLPPNNPLGVFLLKPQADAIVAKDAEIASLKSQLANADGTASFFTNAWFNKRSIAPGEAPDVSPVFNGPGDLVVTTDN
jgi:hypothetical protein